MKNNYHLINDGELKRKDDTLYFDAYESDSKYIPVNDVEAIYAHGQITFNTRVLDFLDNHCIAIHIFSWSDQFSGSFIPTKNQTSGSTVVSQVDAYQHPQRRSTIAKEIVRGSIHNMKQNILYYNRKTDHNFEDTLDKLDETVQLLEEVDAIDEIMGVEATAKKKYYSTFSKIIPDEFEFEKRTYNPPSNELNALISFGNSLLYSAVTSSIRKTALDPTISYLHEPGDRRPSLSLDIADIFKPVIVDRLIFKVLNRNQIQVDDFSEETYQLDESARNVFLEEFEEFMEETVEHPNLERHVSYQYLLRLEVYGLKKHILTKENYSSFKRWW